MPPRQSKRQKVTESVDADVSNTSSSSSSKASLPSLDSLVVDGKVEEKVVGKFAQNISTSELVGLINQDISDEDFHVVVLLVIKKIGSEGSFMTEFSRHDDSFQSFVELASEKFIVAAEHMETAKWKLHNLIRFLVESFARVDDAKVRSAILRFVSLPCWVNLSPERRSLEFEASPSLVSNWEKFQSVKEKLASKPASKKRGEKRKTSSPEDSLKRDENTMATAISLILSLVRADHLGEDDQLCCKSLLELLILILSHPVTRKYFAILLDDKHVVALLRLNVDTKPHLASLKPWVSLVEWFVGVGADDGSIQRDFVLELQRLAFAEFPEKLKDLMYSSHGTISDRTNLSKTLRLLDASELVHVAHALKLWTSNDDASYPNDSELALKLIVDKVCTQPNPVDAFVSETVYPTEATLFDRDVLPVEDNVQAIHNPIPKLDVQFLNILDYLHRSYHLYRLESAFEIREDIVDAVRKMQPKQAITGSVGFTGAWKMATPIIGTSIDNVAKARIGESYPARVTITTTIDLHAFSGETRSEWEDLRESDVVFLLFINRPRSNRGDFQLTQFLDDYGVRAIRGAEIVEIRDEAGNLLKGNR